MKLEASDVSFFPVSPAMSLSEDRSWEAYKTMPANEASSLRLTSLRNICSLGAFALANISQLSTSTVAQNSKLSCCCYKLRIQDPTDNR
jgi:hypothetical protein